RRCGCRGCALFPCTTLFRSEYGLISPLVTATERGIETRGGALRSLLSTDRPATIEGSTARFTFTLHTGEAAGFAHHAWRSFDDRSEEHTPELQSRGHLVRRL